MHTPTTVRRAARERTLHERPAVLRARRRRRRAGHAARRRCSAASSFMPSRSAAARLIDDGLRARRRCARARRRTASGRGSASRSRSLRTTAATSIAEDIPLDIRYRGRAHDRAVEAGRARRPSRAGPLDRHARARAARALRRPRLARRARTARASCTGSTRTRRGLMMVAKTDEAQVALQEAHQGPLDRPSLPHSRARLHRSRHGAHRRAARSRPARSHAHGGLGPGRREAGGHDVPRARALRGGHVRRRLHACSSASCTRAAPTRSACTWPTSAHPCVGDQIYGAAQTQGRPRTRAAVPPRVPPELDHPITGERLVFVDPLPEDLAEALGLVEDRSMSADEAGDEVLRGARQGPSALASRADRRSLVSDRVVG